jgi:hypothetical protein
MRICALIASSSRGFWIPSPTGRSFVLRPVLESFRLAREASHVTLDCRVRRSWEGEACGEIGIVN